MDITTIETVKREKEYMTRAELMENFSMKKASIDNRLKGLREEIKNGRYPAMSIIKDGGFIFVNYLVFLDYLANRDKLNDKYARKHVKPYNAFKAAKEIGWK